MLTNQTQERRIEKERKMLPYVIEFVKFSAGFLAIIAAALVTLHVASAAMQ